MGELYQHLTAKYNKYVRPVKNNSDAVTVKMGLKMIQIADVVRRGILMSSCLSMRVCSNEPIFVPEKQTLDFIRSSEGVPLLTLPLNTF